MHIDLSNKIAVVTGGTTGIGLSVAEIFAGAGAQVAICSSSEANVDAALSLLKGKNIDAYGEVVDVSNRDSIFSFADTVEEKLGGIDIWVSNAAISSGKKLIDTPEDLWQRVMDINVKSVYYGGLIAAGKIKKRGGGVLINAASFASLMPRLGSGAYAASKAAVYSMTKTLGAELAPFNIRVVCFAPGMIKTRMTEKLIEAKSEELQRQAALQRIGEPEEVAKLVLFLASDLAAYITGCCVEISGGKFCVQNPQDAWFSAF
jgi:NAD(P)-dependent dehydrogenase (short-subunit alcohol dehydrogenase family)